MSYPAGYSWLGNPEGISAANHRATLLAMGSDFMADKWNPNVFYDVYILEGELTCNKKHPHPS